MWMCVYIEDVIPIWPAGECCYDVDDNAAAILLAALKAKQPNNIISYTS